MWKPVFVFLTFNLGDCFGRLFASKFHWRIRPAALTTIVLLRVIYLVLIPLCNIQPRQSLPVVFKSEISFVILLFTMALTQGYFATIAIVGGMEFLKNNDSSHLLESAGALFNFFIASGLLS